MGITSVLVGSPYFRRRMMIPISIGAGILGVGWLYGFSLIEEYLPQQIGLIVFLAVPVVLTIGAVGLFAYNGEGVLLGWVIGAAVVFGPIVLMGYDMIQKERSMGRDVGIGEGIEILLGGVVWSSLFASVVGVIGLVLGGGLRLLTRSDTE